MAANRFCYFTTVLYPDCMPHFLFIQGIDNAINFTGLKVCYILHDKCTYVAGDYNHETNELVTDDLIGTPKKAHWHIYCKTPYQMTESNFSESFGRLVQLPPKRIQGVRSPVAVSLYLTHSDVNSKLLGKHLYDVSEIKGDVQILSIDDDKSFIDFYNAVYSWRNNYFDGERTFAELTMTLHLQGFDNYIKRNQFICTRIMSEAVKLKGDVVYALQFGNSSPLYNNMEDLL